MRLPAVFLTAVLCSTGMAAANDPVTGTLQSFFGYREPAPPVGGDCAAIASAIGPEATWFGSFAGAREIQVNEYQPYGAQACFENELNCRVWQRRALNYAAGPVVATSCRLGAPRGFFR
jgi:hypothetical protein